MRVCIGMLCRNSKLLICRRLGRREHAHLMEFPGGKAENGESPFDTLYRELFEELGIRIASSTLILECPYPYDPAVLLEFYLVTDWIGEPMCLDHEEIVWETFTAIRSRADLINTAMVLAIDSLEEYEKHRDRSGAAI